MVLNAEPYGYSDAAVATWRASGYEYMPAPWDEQHGRINPKVEGLIVRLARKVDGAVLDCFPNLSFVVSATTGWDHLDTDELAHRNVRLYSLRDHKDFLRTIPSTAEHTWALLLALARNVTRADQDVRSGHWCRDVHRGIQVKGRTLGIVGMGRTGQRVARYAQAFEMRVQYYDPYIDEVAASSQVDSLALLIQTSDVVSLHVHLTEETERLIGADEISLMRQGVLLINTSRGRIWDEQAVAAALHAGKVGGVAADVLENEFVSVEANPLWRVQQSGANVILTPHIGGATWDAMHACERLLARVVIETETSIY